MHLKDKTDAKSADTFSLNRPQDRFSLVIAMSVCLFVCLSRLSVVIVYYAQMVRVLVFHHHINYVTDIMKFLNLEGYQISMIGVKVTAILMTISWFLHT